VIAAGPEQRDLVIAHISAQEGRSSFLKKRSKKLLRRRLYHLTRAVFSVPVVLLAACDAPPPVAAAPAPVAETQSEYVIGPGDILSISVYQAPPLSVTDLPVRPDGRISVPLVPDVVAAGKTTAQLGHEIEARLKKYVQTPNVTVMVRGFQGSPDRQIRVVGAAAEAQNVPYRANMTLLDVMIAAKGLTKFAAGNSAFILRRSNGTDTRIPVRISDLLKDGDLRQNVTMRPGDTLIIPQSWF
jgi:polysaccharide export outer membrane protein